MTKTTADMQALTDKMAAIEDAFRGFHEQQQRQTELLELIAFYLSVDEDQDAAESLSDDEEFEKEYTL